MSHRTVEDRLAFLEEEVAIMKAEKTNDSATKDWRRTVGKFPGMQELFAEAMKLREADRKKARKQPGKRIRAKS